MRRAVALIALGWTFARVFDAARQAMDALDYRWEPR